MKPELQKTVVGTIVFNDGRKRFLPKSPEYLQTEINRFIVGAEVRCIFTQKKATRSQAQLSYHFVLLGLISDHTGYTVNECHEYAMIMVFGTKLVAIDGRAVPVRRSIANRAQMTKAEMAELLDFDFSLCSRLDIVVPSAEELGYLPNH